MFNYCSDKDTFHRNGHGNPTNTPRTNNGDGIDDGFGHGIDDGFGPFPNEPPTNEGPRGSPFPRSPSAFPKPDPGRGGYTPVYNPVSGGGHVCV